MMRYLVILAVGFLTSCTSFMSQEPRRQTVMVAAAPEVVYRQATQALVAMGGQQIQTHPDMHMVTGVVHRAVVLVVTVEPVPDGGSRVQVTGTLREGQVVLGSFTEVEDYLTLLREAAL